MKTNPCARCKYNNTPEGVMVCDECVYDLSRKDRFRPLTNADRIRNMTDEELAKLMSGGDHICDRIPECVCKETKCFDCCLAWLRTPANDGGNEK